MKNSTSLLFAIIFGIFLISGCASTKKLASAYVGKWNYDLQTPQGNISGNMEIKEAGKDFSGALNSDMGSVDLTDLLIKDGKLTAKFEVQGNEMDLKGDFQGDEFNGTISASGFDIPFKATRAK